MIEQAGITAVLGSSPLLHLVKSTVSVDVAYVYGAISNRKNGPSLGGLATGSGENNGNHH